MKFSLSVVFVLLLSQSGFAQKSSNYPLGKRIEYHYGYNSDHSRDSAIYTFTYDTMHREVFDEIYHLVNGNKTNYSITNFTYDSGGTFMNCEISNYNSSSKQFVKSEGRYIKYDASGHTLYFNSGSFSGNNLVLRFFRSYQYDSSGKRISGVTIDTLKHSGDKHLYSYNKSGSMIADTQFFWYTKKNIWARESLTLWNKNGLNLDSINTIQSWDGVKWTNMSRDEYFYDSLKTLCKTVHQEGSDTIWTNEFSDSTKNDSSGWTIYEDEWDQASSQWIIRVQDRYIGTKSSYCHNEYIWDSSKKAYSTLIDVPDVCVLYDSKGHVVSAGSDNRWGDINYFQSDWTYDSVGRLTFYRDFDNYDLNEYTYFYYPMYTSIEKQNYHNKFLFHLYPNPSPGNYTLSFPGSFSGDLMVYDMLGNLKLQEYISGQDKVSFDLNEPAGMYFLWVIEKNTDNIYTEKLIKY